MFVFVFPMENTLPIVLLFYLPACFMFAIRCFVLQHWGFLPFMGALRKARKYKKSWKVFQATKRRLASHNMGKSFLSATNGWDGRNGSFLCKGSRWEREKQCLF
ncbi:hypothetical protein QBC38DRAFT_203948 [Podospora fimiseda]|uniref:Uncharacterized protein n=1 Tax=Podospora fimiseda TaxID=252190 RepID=A0AAN7BZF9_9PEZI|nr:hypothetical protein QBC38DRAFT_203948 [Podospora fimiseda]